MYFESVNKRVLDLSGVENNVGMSQSMSDLTVLKAWRFDSGVTG